MNKEIPAAPTNVEDLWRTALADIELQISPANFATWFRHTKILAKQGGEIMIGVPSGFTKEWLENKYHKYILRALRALDPEIKDVSYTIGSAKPHTDSQERTRWKEGDTQNLDDHWQLPIEQSPVNKTTNLNLKYTFDSFVVGPSNEIAHAAAQAILSQPGTLYNPFFVYGGGIIHDFSLTLLVGMISGTYSTVFVASPVLVWIHNRQVNASSQS